MLLLCLLCLPWLGLAGASPDEFVGNVTEVKDGDSIVVEGMGAVRMADIDCHQLPSPEGVASRDFTVSWLQGKRVFLDIDDMGSRCPSGCRICVVYVENPDGTINPICFNRMLVDAGHAVLHDRANEWDPSLWWQLPES
ncbi:MAG: hypothetical protein GKC10_06490 [Methanosarcinales archaeon]|nr:hypothetical protein [Methanosarcinales archaeon]